MATRQEIIEVIDAFLENRITQKEAYEWASKESTRTPDCEDQASALYTLIASGVWDQVMSRPLREKLLMDREVLTHDIPCPQEELGKTIDAYSLVFAPWKKIVLCQIRITEKGDRILELMEEKWDGTQLFHEETPLPLKDEDGPPLSSEHIDEKREAYRSGKMTKKEYLQWVLDQLQRKSAVGQYENLLLIYWKLYRPQAWFTLEYIEGWNKSKNTLPALEKLIEIVREKEKERKKREKEKH